MLRNCCQRRIEAQDARVNELLQELETLVADGNEYHANQVATIELPAALSLARLVHKCEEKNK